MLKRVAVLLVLLMMSAVFVGYAEESPWQYVETIKGREYTFDTYINLNSIKRYNHVLHNYVECQLKIINHNGTYSLWTVAITKNRKDWATVVREEYSSDNELIYTSARREIDELVWGPYKRIIIQKTFDTILELEQERSTMVCVGYAEESQWQYIETFKNEDIYINPNSIQNYRQIPYDYVTCTLKLNNNNDGTFELWTIIINKDTKDWASVVFEQCSSDNDLTYKYTSQILGWNRYNDGIFQQSIDTILELEQKGSK